MEPLWSPAVATGGNRWQMGWPQKRRRQAETVAADCDRLPESFHGTEGVDGSSPSEGLRKSLQMSDLLGHARPVQRRSHQGRTRLQDAPMTGDGRVKATSTATRNTA